MEDDASLIVEYGDLTYPEEINSEAAIEKLDQDSIESFTFDFDDERWDASHNLCDTILLVNRRSEYPVTSVTIWNSYQHTQNRNECFEYFLRVVETHSTYNS